MNTMDHSLEHCVLDLDSEGSPHMVGDDKNVTTHFADHQTTTPSIPQPRCLTPENHLFITHKSIPSNTKGCMPTAATLLMPPETASRPWDFTPVLDLLDAFSTSRLPRPPTPPPIPNGGVPYSLGDFDRLWLHLGKPTGISPPEINNEIDSSLSDEDLRSTASSSPLDDLDPEYKDKGKEVRWKDEVHGTDLDEYLTNYVTKVIQKAKSPSRKKSLKPRLKPNLNYASEFESETDIQIGSRTPISHRPKPLNTSLWTPPPIPDIRVDPTVILPLFTLTAEEKRNKLNKKLLSRYGAEEGSRLSSEGYIHPAVEWGDNVSYDGIHVFVDCSNIMIGFYNALKVARDMNIHTFVKQPPISYHNLALVMERGRPVARRILLGSTSRSAGGINRLPSYMTEAEQCGYELSILERVLKPKDRTPKKRRPAGTGNGYATSGQSSGSEAPYYGNKAIVEQGVDEILHMKFLETLVDYHKPTTIILASGDAAEAEYSGGFLKNVERALVKGWKVEIVSWKDNLSQAYKAPAFLQKWKGRFMIVELDDYSEELLAIYTKPHIFPELEQR